MKQADRRGPPMPAHQFFWNSVLEILFPVIGLAVFLASKG